MGPFSVGPQPPEAIRLCPDESREDGSSAPISRDRASPFSVCFLAFSIDEGSLSTENHKPRDPHNAARPRINWSFLVTSIREYCYSKVGATSGVSSRWAGAVGLAQEAPKWNRKPPKMRQEVGAGGNTAREGGRDACAGRGARSVVVRHLKVPI